MNIAGRLLRLEIPLSPTPFWRVSHNRPQQTPTLNYPGPVNERHAVHDLRMPSSIIQSRASQGSNAQFTHAIYSESWPVALPKHKSKRANNGSLAKRRLSRIRISRTRSASSGLRLRPCALFQDSHYEKLQT